MDELNRVITDHLRCPEESISVGLTGQLSENAGFFDFGSNVTCYGKCSAFKPSPQFHASRKDARAHSTVEGGVVNLPFNLTDIVETLRREEYTGALSENVRNWSQSPVIRMGYYVARPLMSVAMRKHLQRLSLRGWEKRPFPHWPVDTTVEQLIDAVVGMALRSGKEKSIPFIWFWPEGKQACAVMTHDVETTEGRDFCERLMDVNDSYGIKASFQVVPERRYTVPQSYLDSIVQRGFEVNVQDLNHDGRLFDDYEEFKRRSKSINQYGAAFNARGFRAAVLYRKVQWLNALQFDYDMSIPTVAHLDPQRGGCCTIFPYFIGNLVEIPVTTTQDYSLFHILRDYTLDLWKKQAARIIERHGVMNFIIHPDYVTEKREMDVYKALLGYLAELRNVAGLWTPLPREVNDWWRLRSKMRLVRNGDGWKIEGEGKERARIAYVRLENDEPFYELEGKALPSN